MSELEYSFEREKSQTKDMAVLAEIVKKRRSQRAKTEVTSPVWTVRRMMRLIASLVSR